MQSEIDAAAERVAGVLRSTGAKLEEVSRAVELLRPALADLSEMWCTGLARKERTLRERLGIWRYLSPEWWALRKYRKESGDAGG